MKNIGYFFAGIALIILGAAIFLRNVSVGSFSFYNYGRIPAGIIVLVLAMVSFVVMIVKQNAATIAAFIIMLILLVVVIVLSLKINVHEMNALKLVCILLVMCSGIGMVIRSILGLKKDETGSNQ